MHDRLGYRMSSVSSVVQDNPGIAYIDIIQYTYHINTIFQRIQKPAAKAEAVKSGAVNRRANAGQYEADKCPSETRHHLFTLSKSKRRGCTVGVIFC